MSIDWRPQRFDQGVLGASFWEETVRGKEVLEIYTTPKERQESAWERLNWERKRTVECDWAQDAQTWWKLGRPSHVQSRMEASHTHQRRESIWKSNLTDRLRRWSCRLCRSASAIWDSILVYQVEASLPSDWILRESAWVWCTSWEGAVRIDRQWESQKGKRPRLYLICLD